MTMPRLRRRKQAGRGIVGDTVGKVKEGAKKVGSFIKTGAVRASPYLKKAAIFGGVAAATVGSFALGAVAQQEVSRQHYERVINDQEQLWNDNLKKVHEHLAPAVHSKVDQARKEGYEEGRKAGLKTAFKYDNQDELVEGIPPAAIPTIQELSQEGKTAEDYRIEAEQLRAQDIERRAAFMQNERQRLEVLHKRKLKTLEDEYKGKEVDLTGRLERQFNDEKVAVKVKLEERMKELEAEMARQIEEAKSQGIFEGIRLSDQVLGTPPAHNSSAGPLRHPPRRFGARGLLSSFKNPFSSFGTKSNAPPSYDSLYGPAKSSGSNASNFLGTALNMFTTYQQNKAAQQKRERIAEKLGVHPSDLEGLDTKSYFANQHQ